VGVAAEVGGDVVARGLHLGVHGGGGGGEAAGRLEQRVEPGGAEIRIDGAGEIEGAQATGAAAATVVGAAAGEGSHEEQGQWSYKESILLHRGFIMHATGEPSGDLTRVSRPM